MRINLLIIIILCFAFNIKCVNYTFQTDGSAGDNIWVYAYDKYNSGTILTKTLGVSNPQTFSGNYSFFIINGGSSKSINAPSGQSLRVSSLGYVDMKVVISNCQLLPQVFQQSQYACSVSQSANGLTVGSKCAMNSNCNSNQCPNGTCVSSVLGQQCQSTSDCVSGSCVNNICTLSQVSGSCQTNGDCASNNCISTKCDFSPPAGTCKTSADCGSNSCINNSCVISQVNNSCQYGSDCTTGNCINNQCQISSVGGACQFNSDCIVGSCQGAICTISQVGQACKKYSDCSTGNCANGVCQALVTGGYCQFDTDCISSKCDNNQCTAPVSVAKPNPVTPSPTPTPALQPTVPAVTDQHLPIVTNNQVVHTAPVQNQIPANITPAPVDNKIDNTQVINLQPFLKNSKVKPNAGEDVIFLKPVDAKKVKKIVTKKKLKVGVKK